MGATLTSQIRYDHGYVTVIKTLSDPILADDVEVLESGIVGWGENDTIVRFEGVCYLAMKDKPCHGCCGRGGWYSPDNGQWVSCLECKKS